MATASLTNNLASITRTADAKAASSKISDTMGKSEFLTLFTTQLKNQNPLDPVKNEAFVAQLAQFSQLEATTSMQNSMTDLVSALKGDRMMTGASLIGRQVAVPDVPAMLSAGQPVTGIINLPNGADSVKIDFLDESGKVLRSDTLGTQKPGLASFTWDGKDAAGITMPDGKYFMAATAVLAGQTSKLPVNTMTTVQSVSSDPTTQELMLQVAGGGNAPISSIVRVGF